MVQEENSSQLVEGYGLSTEPLLDAMFFMWAAEQPVLNGGNS